MAQLLKRIVVSQRSNVLIEDLGVFFRNRGDSRDLLGNTLPGKNYTKFSLEKICSSRSLDSLVKSGHLKIFDENGTELSSVSGGSGERSTNLATLKDLDDLPTGNDLGYTNYSFVGDGGTTYSVRDISGISSIRFKSNSTIIYLNGLPISRGVDYEEDGNLYEFSLIDIGSSGLPVIPNSQDQFTIIFNRIQ